MVIRRGSYLSRIAGVGVATGPSLAPSRLLFRPGAQVSDELASDGFRTSQREVISGASPTGDAPEGRTRQARASAETALAENAPRESVQHRLHPAPSEHLPEAESATFVKPRESTRPMRHASGAKPVTSAADLSPARPPLMEFATAKSQPGPAQEQAAAASLGRIPQAPKRLADDPPTAPERNPVDGTERRRATESPQANQTDSTVESAKLPEARLPQRPSEMLPTVLTPPLPAAGGPVPHTRPSTEKRSHDRGETGPHVRIGTLEVRITPPPAAPLPRRAAPVPPQSALARGFRSFGLTQG